MKNKLNKELVIKQIITVLILVLVIGYIFKYWNEIIGVLKNKEQLGNWINSFGYWKYAVFILIQILQVVIFIIPGEVMYIAGGYLFGSLLASVLSIIGITLGSLICFGVARIIGQPIVQKLMSKNNIEHLKSKINTPKASITLFMIFLIPGLPGKDALAYIAGVTPIRFSNFFLVTLIARSPWIIAASLWGANLEQGDYKMLIIITLLAAIVFMLGILKGEALIKHFSGD